MTDTCCGCCPPVCLPARSPYLLHRDPKVWGIDADEFRPERWEQWQSKEGYGGFMTLLSGLGPNGSYMPFGGGPR